MLEQKTLGAWSAWRKENSQNYSPLSAMASPRQHAAPKHFTIGGENKMMVGKQDEAPPVWHSEYRMSHQQLGGGSVGSGVSIGSGAGFSNWTQGPVAAQMAPLTTSNNNNNNINTTTTPSPTLTNSSRAKSMDMAALDESTKDTIIAELKEQNEALVTGIALGNVSGSGSMDAMEIAHRILTRVRSLRAENERLMNIASSAHAAQLEIENDQLRRELEMLRARLN